MVSSNGRHPTAGWISNPKGGGGNSLFENTTSACTPPYELGAKDIRTDEATIYWNDLSGNTWEYYVVPQGAPTPSTFITTSNKEERITQDASGTNLQPDTQYEFYVRTSCGTDNTSNWAGPYRFRTACTSFVIPFWEGFNTDSSAINCWTIVDNDNDDSKWKATKTSPYEGDQMMVFDGLAWYYSTDDWLISPAFTLDAAKVYQLRYNYKVRLFSGINLRVLLSKDGTALSDFTTVLLDQKIDESDEFWREETILIGGVSGDIHLAWQILSKEIMPRLGLDNVFLVEIDCPYPENLGVKYEKEDQATIVWKDYFNTSWEYIVQKEGEGYPSGTGTSSATKEVIITTDKSGTTLTPNTGYEFYVRSKCSNGDFSDWMGPFVFRTTCTAFTPPFSEGFNTTSPTINCWTIVDVDEDGQYLDIGIPGINPEPIGFWGMRIFPQLAYEGDALMEFRMNPNLSGGDDWLISPAITLTGGIYAVSYYFRANIHYYMRDDNELEVRLSENGTALSEFTTVLLPKKNTLIAIIKNKRSMYRVSQVKSISPGMQPLQQV